MAMDREDMTAKLDQAEVRRILGEARVGIVGLGGLGSNVAVMLVRSGVRHLVLADHDVVDVTNLNRQHYFTDQLGRPKTDALAESLLRIEPELRLTLLQQRVTADNLGELFAGMDVFVEAVDAAETKAMLVSTAAEVMPQVPVVWASGLAGCDSANVIRTQRITESCWLVGDLLSDVRDGLPLLASRVMTAAAHEAHMVVRLLLGMPEE